MKKAEGYWDFGESDKPKAEILTFLKTSVASINMKKENKSKNQYLRNIRI